MPDRERGPGRELVVCVLNAPDYLNDVLTAFVEAGVSSATVLESQGMARILTTDVPIFAGFRHLFAGSQPYNHTIFAVVEDAEVTERIIALVRDVLAEEEGPGKGVIFSVPVGMFVRLADEPA